MSRTRRRGIRPPILVWAAFLAGGGFPAAAAAQNAGTAPEIRQRWTLENLRSGWCVHFLMDSAKAAKAMPKGQLPRPAFQVDNLHPAISQLIEEEPQYAAWTPAQLCSFYFDAIVADDQRVAGKSDESVALAWWGIAAAPGEGSADPAAGGAGVLGTTMLASNNWRLQKWAETVFFQVKKVDMAMSKLPEGGDDRFVLKDGKTVIAWEGHATRDSTLTADPVPLELVTLGLRNVVWQVEGVIRPERRRMLAGVLRVEGKNDLAKALRASPVRLVGPMYLGGAGELTLSR